MTSAVSSGFSPAQFCIAPHSFNVADVDDISTLAGTKRALEVPVRLQRENMTLFYWHIVLNLSLVTLLAMNISRLRIRERVGLGDGGKLALKKAIRPHANALEHVLPFSFMVFVAASLEVGETYLLILVASFFVSRLVHAASYLYGSDIARQLSASVSYLCELAALVSIVAALMQKH